MQRLLRSSLFTQHQPFHSIYTLSTTPMTTPTKRPYQKDVYDLVVIGGGSGGLAAARRARSLGSTGLSC